MEIKAAILSLAALAQETRLSVFRLLVKAGLDGMSAGRIGESLKVPPATLSFHLKELSHAGLVATRQQKQFIYYAVDFRHMAELMRFLTENCCHGMPEVCLAEVHSALEGCCPPSAITKRKSKRRRS